MAKAAVATTDHEQTNATLEQVTSGPQRLVQFLKETRQEMHKVVVPTRNEVKNMTFVVLISVFMFAAFFELVDVILSKSLDKVLLQLSGR